MFAGRMWPAGRVFETPALNTLSFILQFMAIKC